MSTWSAGFWLGILLTLNFLTYFYSWTYALMFIGMTGLLLLTTTLLPGLGLPIPSIENSRYIFVVWPGERQSPYCSAFQSVAGSFTKNPVVHATFLRSWAARPPS